MKLRETGIVAIALLVSCAPADEAALTWESDGEQRYELFTGTAHAPLSSGDAAILESLLAIEPGGRSREIVDAARALLPVADLAPDVPPADMIVSPVEGARLRVRVLSPPMSASSGASAATFASRAPELTAVIDAAGRPLSKYLTREAHRFTSLLFALPRDPVSPGESWEVPVNLVELGNGFRASSPKQRSFATLSRLETDESGTRLAEIVYFAAEEITGDYSFSADDPPEAFSLSALYVGLGKLDLSRRVWTEYRGRLVARGRGSAAMLQSDRSMVVRARRAS